MSYAADTVSTIVPALRYRDAHAAIEWLCRALGFERHAVYEDGNGGIAHAQLKFGNGMIMLGSARDDAWGKHFAGPRDIGGRVTMSCCLIVSDAKAHYDSTRAAGATIVDELHSPDYGGQAYSCRDPEGNLWWFGSYDPWRE
jgi:uncharacterized glyoxalase superfamily protein PhnB